MSYVSVKFIITILKMTLDLKLQDAVAFFRVVARMSYNLVNVIDAVLAVRL